MIKKAQKIVQAICPSGKNDGKVPRFFGCNPTFFSLTKLKFGTYGPLPRAKFHFYQCNVWRLFDEKKHFQTSE